MIEFLLFSFSFDFQVELLNCTCKPMGRQCLPAHDFTNLVRTSSRYLVLSYPISLCTIEYLNSIPSRIEVSVEGEGIGEKGQRDLNDLKVEFSGIEMLIYPFRPPSLLSSSSCEGWQPWTQSLHLYRTCKNFAKHNLTSFLFRQRDFDHKSADVRSSNSTI